MKVIAGGIEITHDEGAVTAVAIDNKDAIDDAITLWYDLPSLAKANGIDIASLQYAVAACGLLTQLD